MKYETFVNRLENDEDDKFKRLVYRRFYRYLQERSLKPFQAELIKLQEHLEKQQKKMIVLVEGRDAAGKGGSLRRITRYMNEKHYRVIALGKPSDVQLSQWYFQRYVEQFPRGGEIVFFDRSWYNRAMVEPVFGFCTPEQYNTFMKTVSQFEDDLVEHGIIFHKIYFSVSKDTQAKRFAERETNVLKMWKLSEIDVQMQEKWDEFTKMKYQMLKQTHSHVSPWVIIRSNDKYQARLHAIKSILNKVDYEGRNMELDYTVDPHIYYSGAHEIELMENQLRETGKFIV
ncbi:MAG: polyphosphate kinase 2 [Gammaproteobacteria bacterium]|jgi:polyphosphate kinase 2|nr:polyphosphate kinase 2 [Gammaproteobacteria bacterium]